MRRTAFLLLVSSLAIPALAQLTGQTVNATIDQGRFGNATYDYVIVGGGTSGLALAARLAEDPSVSVAVVEAGGYYELDGTIASVIPGLAAGANVGTDITDHSMVDWNFESQPLTSAHNRSLRYARGKTLGGSSARHYMVYQRGTKGSYDQWAEMVGDNSWEWDAVFPYFQRSVNVTAANMTSRLPNTTVVYDPAGFKPSGGPLHVTWPNYGSPWSTWIEQGLEAIGVHPDTDFNTGSLNGSSWAPITINPQSQTRDSSETSFLQQALQNTNLTVYLHTMALKIKFDGTTATSVDLRSSVGRFTLSARKEIVVSAGTLQSPQLLMVSGIGPRETLESHGIPVVKELAGVGQNMWEHSFFGVTHQVNLITATELAISQQALVQALAEYKSQQGPLTSAGFGVLGWERLPNSTFSEGTNEALATFPSDWPMIEYLSIDGYLDGWHSAADQNVGDGQQWGTIAAALVAPLSRGNVTISSADMDDPPVFDLGFLTHPADREMAVAAMRRIRQAFAAVSKITIGPETVPGPDVATDEELLDFIRETIVPVYHVAGTNAMGREDDPLAVVDTHARVIGVRNLRVVDASIFPTLPPGHPQSTCYMVAEKIADLIRSGN
ncbi:hypothetical protein BDW74DRAFT_166460 [Aspergillus multicolor]|uniref:GMC family oxidoreductase n=1 Tax=Aspergillus multicolor TaxID=41759 RepID=UPI003CCCA5E2